MVYIGHHYACKRLGLTNTFLLFITTQGRIKLVFSNTLIKKTSERTTIQSSKLEYAWCIFVYITVL